MSGMSLRTTVRSATIGAAVGSVLILAAMAGAFYILDRAQSAITAANLLMSDAGKLNLLTSELFVHQSKRVRHQWIRQHDALLQGVLFAPDVVGQADALKNEIGQRVRSIRRLLSGDKPLTLMSSLTSEMTSEQRAILFSAVIGHSNAIFSRTAELHDLVAENAAATRQYVLLGLGGLFLLLFVGGGFVMLTLSTSMLAHILNLRRMIIKLGQGQLDIDVPQYSANEMGDVFRELDRMRCNLLETMSDLGRANLELIGTKVKLEDRTASLEAANHELEAFTAAVSHDLRAPLRTVSGFSQAVIEDYGEKIDVEGQAMLARIHRAAVQMYQLIEDLLRLSQIGRDRLERELVNISALTKDVFETIREQHPARKVMLTVQPEMTAYCDGQLVRVVLTNLLENACKFTSKEEIAEIEVGRKFEEGRQVYFVRDNGAGFDMTFADNLFKPFKRLHAISEYPGTGVGLATAARVVNLHGGKIWASSVPGNGATFFFEFGKADSPHAAEHSDDDGEGGAMASGNVQRMPLRAGRAS